MSREESHEVGDGPDGVVGRGDGERSSCQLNGVSGDEVRDFSWNLGIDGLGQDADSGYSAIGTVNLGKSFAIYVLVQCRVMGRMKAESSESNRVYILV